MYDALSARFTSVKLRARRSDCAACSSSSELRTPGGVAAYDYAAFTGAQDPPAAEGGGGMRPGSEDGPERVTAVRLHRMLRGFAESEGARCAEQPQQPDGGTTHVPESGEGGNNGAGTGVVLVDVRPKELFLAARLPGSMHVGMREVRRCQSVATRAVNLSFLRKL